MLLVSLQNRVVILIVVIIVFLTTILSIIIGSRASTDVKMQVGISLSDTAYQMTSRLDQYMWGRSGEIRVLSETPLIKRGKREETERLLNNLRDIYPAFSWIGITDIQGNVLAGTDGILVGQSLAKRPVYIEGMKGEFIGDVHDAVLLANLLPNPMGEPMKFVDVSFPVQDDKKQTIGVIAAHLSWEWARQIEESMFKILKERNSEEFFIVSRVDNVILLGPKELIGKKLEIDSVKRARSGEVGWAQEYWPDGNEYITGFAAGSGYLDFKGLGWIVLVRKPTAVAYGPVHELQLFIWLTGILFSGLFAIIGWGMTGNITKPLREIAKAADQLRFGGDIDVPQAKGIREIDILADSLRELIHAVSLREKELGKMEAMAFYDRLTNLPNRAGLEQFIKKSMSIFDDHSSLAIAVLYMDLDGFKKINDTFGHSAGDRVLKAVAQRLEKNIREGEIIARIGGDEFVGMLLVPKGREEAAIGAVAKRIIRDMNQPIPIEGANVTIGCSIGCTVWQKEIEIKEALAIADNALYAVKKSGKNQYKIWNNRNS